MSDLDKKFMKAALWQAKKGLGRTSPNPVVGAVIVLGKKIIATGYHRQAGMPHAEIEALTKLGESGARGATLYVTLEPCNHHGRTPPCTEAILKSGLRRVVIGMKDPNPHVAGCGCEFLRDRGIQVVTGVLEKQCQRLNEAFIKFISANRPFVISKSALTLDGWTATSTGHSKWITSKKSRDFVHRLRDQVDAVMVGIGTVLTDDPRLTTRLEKKSAKDPKRIILDTNLRTPITAKIVNHDSSEDTYLVVDEKLSMDRRSSFLKKGIKLILNPTKNGRIDLPVLLDHLAQISVSSLLVEGGANILGSFIKENMIDKFYIFKSPKILGGDDGIPLAAGHGAKKMDESISLTDLNCQRFGDDILITGYPVYHF